MNKRFDEYVENGCLLAIVDDFINELVAEATEDYFLAPGDLRPITRGDARKVRTTVLFRGQIVFEVGFLAGEGLGYFLLMTREQAREEFYRFFSALGGKAA